MPSTAAPTASWIKIAQHILERETDKEKGGRYAPCRYLERDYELLDATDGNRLER